ncbi:MAG: phosphate ABC transporter substrate-binding protein [Gammaproteobacteria bacterium]
MLLLLLTAVARAAAADGLYLACHAGVSLASADVRDVFLGEKQFQNTVRLVPVDNVAIQTAFLERVLKMNDIKYAVTWAKKSFRDGISPPPAMANDAAVLDFIKRTPGGCGYLGADPPPDVNVVGRY